MLGDYHFRSIWGASIKEGLEVFDKAGIKPENVLKLPISLFPYFLSSDIIFWVVRNIQRVDKKGYSSMSQDLQKKRNTEVDFINGEIIEIASRVGASAPINTKISQLIKEMETNNREGRENVPKPGAVLARDIGIPKAGPITVDRVLVTFFLLTFTLLWLFW
jgi:2-dehydropantoate 2-reductase